MFCVLGNDQHPFISITMMTMLKKLRNAIALPFLLPYILLHNSRSCTEDPKKRLKRRNALMPKTLRPGREAVSFSYKPTTNAKSQLLSKLPLEIRQKIYTYALGTNLVHLVLTPHRVAHIICTKSTATDFERECCPSARGCFVPGSIEIAPSDINVRLLRTCRQVYAEVVQILYSTNTFDVDDLSAFNHFAAIAPPVGLSSIRSLHLHWINAYPPLEFIETQSPVEAPYDDTTYLRFWQTTANRMPALRELRLAINDLWDLRGLSMKDPWVQAVKKVSGLTKFELETVSYNQLIHRLDEEQVITFTDELRQVVCRKLG